MEARAEMSMTEDNVQVVAKARRRVFTAEYKRRILEAADACATAAPWGRCSGGTGCLVPPLSGFEGWPVAARRFDVDRAGAERAAFFARPASATTSHR
jgi:hypothetical protein